MATILAAPGASRSRRRLRRGLLQFAGVAAGAYLAVIIVLLALENRLLFHPLRVEESWEPPPNPRVQDVTLAIPDGTRLHAWWCPIDGADGAVLYCHGNAGNLSHRGGKVTEWQRHLRHNVLIFDYPGYGRSEGTPSEAGCYAAGLAAYSWLTEMQHVAPEQVVIYGGSLGGGVAVELASRRVHRALILVSAFSSVPEVAQQLYPWLPARWLVRNRFDNLAKIGACRGPIFIAHGDCDPLVPFAHGRRLFTAAGEPKEFFAMPGCDHDRAPTAAFYPALKEFLARTVARSETQRATRTP
jgi:fermentation-respiration switch protein FrsA (DUF1100 family)